jgi:hypothetical protein
MMHTCPVKDCPKLMPHALLMCGPHWQMVPQKLKNGVNRSWKAFNETSPSFAEATGRAYDVQSRADRLREYQAARRAAVDAVEASLAGAPR